MIGILGGGSSILDLIYICVLLFVCIYFLDVAAFEGVR